MSTEIHEFDAESFQGNYNMQSPVLNIEKGNRVEIIPHEKYINNDPSTKQFVFIESGKTIFKDPHCYHSGKDGKIIEKLNEYDIEKFNRLCLNHGKSYLIDRIDKAFKISIGMEISTKKQNISF